VKQDEEHWQHNMRHDRMMNAAFQIATELQKVSDQKVAAVIAMKNNIIAVGVNQLKTHPMVASCKVNDYADFLHAESSAIINAIRQISSKKLAKCDMFVCRAKLVDGFDRWGLSKPCVDCQEFLKHYPVKRIFYSTDTHGVYEELNN
jgi:deoxycytidylate deaminase